MIKKKMLVVIAAKILSHAATVTTSTETNGECAYVTIKVVLGYSVQKNSNDMPIYAMFDYSYWQRVTVIRPIVTN